MLLGVFESLKKKLSHKLCAVTALRDPRSRVVGVVSSVDIEQDKRLIVRCGTPRIKRLYVHGRVKSDPFTRCVLGRRVMICILGCQRIVAKANSSIVDVRPNEHKDAIVVHSARQVA